MSALATALIAWFRKGHRDLPWRRTHDPYRIWISEIMLQQTRSATVIPYYERFLERFPTVETLAQAAEPDVLACWSGLGYYSRARNLRRAAQAIAAAGAFPRTFDELRALPGIGDYTAAAIASIAFAAPHAAVDGNVLRVVARVTNNAADIGVPRIRKQFASIAQEWLDPRHPGDFNQAMMELGATICLPRNPVCLLCPLAGMCAARAAGTAAELPVKLRRIEPVAVTACVLIIRRRGRLLLRLRPAASSRMAGFWELPAPEDIPAAVPGDSLGEIRHTITHHHYTIEVRKATLPADSQAPSEMCWFAVAELDTIPLSTIARKALARAAKES